MAIRNLFHTLTASKRATPLAVSAFCAALFAAPQSWAQSGSEAATPAASNANTQTNRLPTVTVRESQQSAPVDVSGLGTPLRELPAAATVIDSLQMQAIGARRLADLTAFDSSLTDAYNSAGYWDFLTVRGFVIDNRYNYRREGLPISAETSIPLDNKARVEILKGTSGMQAGTSAPGGLVNYVVKRPTDAPLASARVEFTSRRSLLTAVDLGGRFGAYGAFGYRLNAAYEDLKPTTRNLDGFRRLFSLAADWRVAPGTLIEAEIENSQKNQASQPGWSLLGNTLPAPVDPKVNLNNQPWSQPSEFGALTGSLRLQQRLTDSWRLVAQYGQQNLKTNDRVAFPFGCSAENNYTAYCSDGTFDLYDFRSENERRTTQAVQIKLQGNLNTGEVRHELTLALLNSRARYRFQNQAYNWVGIGNVAGTAVAPADPTLGDTNTNRDERSTELTLADAMHLTPALTVWLGVRGTALNRDSIRTDGTRPTHSTATLLTPWLAVGYRLSAQHTAYASYGQGIESQVVPNKPSQYTNAGVTLPAVKSHQMEVGYKGQAADLGWQAALFRIRRPMTNLDACSRLGITPCLGQFDGEAVHTGLEASAAWSHGAWRLNGGLTALQARRQGSTTEPTTNGQAPTNVPRFVARGQVGYGLPAIPGLELNARVQHESGRNVLADGSLTLPAWTTLDAGLRYATALGPQRLLLNVGIDNLTNRRYWQESPYQYGHVYLFPGSARTLRVGAQLSF